MKVRIASSKDKKQILALLDELTKEANRVAKGPLNLNFPSKVGGNNFEEVIKRQDILIFVAEDNGKLLGIASLFILPSVYHGKKVARIEEFVVTKGMRGRGVGSKILGEILKYCRKNKFKNLKLASEIELVEAHEFYQKNGGKFTEKMFKWVLD